MLKILSPLSDILKTRNQTPDPSKKQNKSWCVSWESEKGAETSKKKKKEE